MIKVAPSKALSVVVNKDMRLVTTKKDKERMLSFTDRMHVLPKLDGIYAIKAGGLMRTRTMAPYRSAIQQRFHHLPDGICGELIVGPRFASDSWAKSTSDVSRKEGPTEAVLHMFDFATEGSFSSRRARLFAYNSEFCYAIDALAIMTVTLGVVQYHPSEIAPEVGEFDTLEGLVLRPASMPYTAGRSSALRPFFMRIKGEETVDGVIVDFAERMHNGNEAKDTHDGKLRRHSHKENLLRTGLVGSIQVKLPSGKTVVVGTGFGMVQAKDMFNRAGELLGCPIELKRHEHVRETLSGEKSEQGAYVFLRLREDKRG
jgi:hypothetical protein